MVAAHLLQHGIVETLDAYRQPIYTASQRKDLNYLVSQMVWICLKRNLLGRRNSS